MENSIYHLHETLDDVLPFHASFYPVHSGLQRLQARFPIFQDSALVSVQCHLYTLATKQFLDHRSVSHLSRLVLGIHLMQKELQNILLSSSQNRQVITRWIPTRLTFSFSTKSTLGCVIGFNLSDCYDVFDEDSVALVLKKNHPEIDIVKDSSYRHVLPNQHLCIIYFEIEKRDQSLFSLAERGLFKANLEHYVRAGFQKLAPAVFMRRNEEEVYKTILTLNREIHSKDDMPQVWISYEQQTKDEVAFLVVLVYASATTHVQPCLQTTDDAVFVPERQITIRTLDGCPIEARVFRVHLKRQLSLVRSDGSLDFYASRRMVAASVKAVVGDFRDFNGGSLIAQHELLDRFKGHFPNASPAEIELIDTFFYGITPLERQALLRCESLLILYNHFLTHRQRKLSAEVPFIFEVQRIGDESYLAIKMGYNWKDLLQAVLGKPEFKSCDLTYTLLENSGGLCFHAVSSRFSDVDRIVSVIQAMIAAHQQNVQQRQVLRIGIEYPPLSLDPRIGGEAHSSHILQLLFEGLTRLNKKGEIEYGIADQIDVASDYRCYVFRLRPAFWNDGSALTAHDFEYAWKTVLSPSFKTPFADLFYPIAYAKEAKEGTVSSNMVGVTALDERTLKVDLKNPAPYFLELVAQPLFYPVRRQTDEIYPQWPYQAGDDYLCNGPYQLALNDAIHHIYRLVKNPRYWDSGSVGLDEIAITQANPHRSLEAFQRGELDWIGSPFGSWYPAYTSGHKGKKTTIRDVSLGFLVLNTASVPFHSERIRQAFAHAINRDRLIDGVSLSLTSAYSILLPRQRDTLPGPFPQHNPELAQQLFEAGLDELGWTLEQFPVLEFSFLEGTIREEISLRLKQQLKDVLGIDCRLCPLPWNALFPRLANGSFQMCLINGAPRTADPFTTLSTFRHANEERNLSKWEALSFQQRLNLIEQEVDRSKRTAYLREAEAELSRAAPIISLFYQPCEALTRQDLEPGCHHWFNVAKSSFHRDRLPGVVNRND